MSDRFVRTHKARKKFLDELAVGSSVSAAARAAGGTPSNFRRWRASDPNFADDWDDAIEEGTDFIEDVATDRALKKSDPLMMMMLKARRPEKYDRGSKLELSGGIDVAGAKQTLLNKIARIQAQNPVQPGPSPEIPALPAPPPEGKPLGQEQAPPLDRGFFAGGGIDRSGAKREDQRKASNG
jgi:hypothetical protein